MYILVYVVSTESRYCRVRYSTVPRDDGFLETPVPLTCTVHILQYLQYSIYIRYCTYMYMVLYVV